MIIIVYPGRIGLWRPLGYTPRQCFSNFKTWGSCNDEGFSSTGGGWGRGELRLCGSNKLSGGADADAAGPRPGRAPASKSPRAAARPAFSLHLPRAAQGKGTLIPGQLLLSRTGVKHCSQAWGSSDQESGKVSKTRLGQPRP